MKSTWLRITRLLLPLAGTMLCGLASAQTHTTETSDFTMRFGASIEKTFARDFALTWSEEVRTRNASSDLDRIYSALGLSYQPAPWVKVAATYTFMARAPQGIATKGGTCATGSRPTLRCNTGSASAGRSPYGSASAPSGAPKQSIRSKKPIPNVCSDRA